MKLGTRAFAIAAALVAGSALFDLCFLCRCGAEENYKLRRHLIYADLSGYAIAHVGKLLQRSRLLDSRHGARRRSASLAVQQTGAYRWLKAG
jgi:hypothetical protein